MQEFRVERSGKHWVLLGGILPAGVVRIGQQWLSSSGHAVEVVDVDEQGWVTYVGEIQPLHTKDNFSFQCKYSLIL